MDKELTPERIKRATALANKDRIIPSGDVIQAMRNANKAAQFIPLKKTLTLEKRKALEKVVRGKK